MGFNNLSDMCCILKKQIHDSEVYYFYPLSMWRKTLQSVTRMQFKKENKKGLKGGKDTEEKGGSFYIVC